MKGKLSTRLSTLGKPEIKVVFKYINNVYAQKTDGKFLILGVNHPKLTCGSWLFVSNEDTIKILQEEVKSER